MSSTIMIRNVDDNVKRLLRIRAAANGRSMAAEARAIVTAAVASGTDETARSLGEVFAAFPDAANVDLPLPPRRVDPPRGSAPRARSGTGE